MQTLKIFSVTNQDTNQNHIATIRLLTKNDFAAYRELDDEIIASLDNKNIYRANTDEFARNCIYQTKGFCTGCFVNQTLVAYCMTYIPKGSPKNLGLDMKLSKQLLPKVAHLDSIGVKPNFRGNGIQQICIRINNNISLQQGYPLLFTTVHPNNIASLRSFTKIEWMIVKIKKKYGGKWRCILQYFPKKYRHNTITESIVLSPHNIEQNQKLLNNGYLGVEALKNGTIRYEQMDLLNIDDNQFDYE